MAKQPSPIKRDILIRVRWLYVLFVLMGVGVFCKILYTQYGPGSADLRRRAAEVVYKRVDIPALRGDIVARDGRTLATTIPMFDVRIDFAAEIIDTTMKNMARSEIRAAALAEKKLHPKERKLNKAIDEQTKARLKNHAALNARALEIFNAQADTLARGLADIFGDRSAAAYKKMIMDARADRRRNRNLRINPRLASYTELEKMMRLPLLNIKRLDKRGKKVAVILHIPVRGCSKIEEVNVRSHPNGSLAERTIGRLNRDTTIQLRGIEGAFDQYLRGTDGNTLMQSISGIAAVPVQDPENREPVNGIDVITTLDVDLQDVAERELRRQLETMNAEWGAVVLMEVATGEIHAISNLTRHRDGSISDDMNYAIGRNMEPGSTFKLATLITLLDDGGMSLDDVIDTEGGKAWVGKAWVVDDHAMPAPITLRRVFEVSSNIGFSKSVHRLYGNDPKRFVDHVCKIGLDKPLQVQIQGSVAPVIRHPGDTYWTKNLTLEKMAYGYSFEITPMRTLALYNAIANGGKMVSPLLVKELRQYGETIRTFRSQTIVDQVCTPRTLDFVRESLEKVVDEGTAGVLKNKYYKVAAKTGTAQVAFGTRGYVGPSGERRYIATMVGYFPADKPKYSCIVVMQTVYGLGNYKTFYGATLSGPVFRAVADRVFASQAAWHEKVSEGVEPATGMVPVKGGRVEDVKAVASKLSLPLMAEKGSKEWGVVKADSASLQFAPVGIEAGRIPSVVGMGLKEAVYLLERTGVKVSFSGRGRVVSQSASPGTVAVRGQVVGIRLE